MEQFFEMLTWPLKGLIELAFAMLPVLLIVLIVLTIISYVQESSTQKKLQTYKPELLVTQEASADRSLPQIAKLPLPGRIAFIQKNTNNIYVVNADGSNLQKLAEGAELPSFVEFVDVLDISADGSTILFASNTTGLIMVFTCDGNRRTYVIPKARIFRLSPDGKKILYTIEGEDGLFISNIDGSDQQKIHSGDLDILAACWSPDGSKVAFTFGNPGVSIIDLQTHSLQRIEVTNREAAAHCDLYACTSIDWSVNNDILLGYSFINLEDPSRIYKLPGAICQSNFVRWLPDGKNVAFVDGNDNLAIGNLDSMRSKIIIKPVTKCFFAWSK